MLCLDDGRMNEFIQAQPYLLYLLLVGGIIILPGMDMAFVLASTLAHGRSAGLAAVAGLVCGGVVHLALATTGIGLLLAAAPRWANALLLIGCAYLCWIGWVLWRHGAALANVDAMDSRLDGDRKHTQDQKLWPTFARAIVTCLLNPKAYIFMLAVFPRFLRADGGSWLQQAAPLGLITAATQVLVYGAVALASSRLRSVLLSNSRAHRQLGRAIGLVLAISASWALTSGWQW
jgi:threonine/homoserine/homoserine lactone efflux protein